MDQWVNVTSKHGMSRYLGSAYQSSFRWPDHCGLHPVQGKRSTRIEGAQLDILAKQLGLLGFLASETLMKDGTANAGLLDQRASFEWLQRHVASFGGDPNKITISVSQPCAGCQSALILLI